MSKTTGGSGGDQEDQHILAMVAKALTALAAVATSMGYLYVLGYFRGTGAAWLATQAGVQYFLQKSLNPATYLLGSWVAVSLVRGLCCRFLRNSHEWCTRTRGEFGLSSLWEIPAFISAFLVLGATALFQFLPLDGTGIPHRILGWGMYLCYAVLLVWICPLANCSPANLRSGLARILLLPALVAGYLLIPFLLGAFIGQVHVADPEKYMFRVMHGSKELGPHYLLWPAGEKVYVLHPAKLKVAPTDPAANSRVVLLDLTSTQGITTAPFSF